MIGRSLQDQLLEGLMNINESSKNPSTGKIKSSGKKAKIRFPNATIKKNNTTQKTVVQQNKAPKSRSQTTVTAVKPVVKKQDQVKKNVKPIVGRWLVYDHDGNVHLNETDEQPTQSKQEPTFILRRTSGSVSCNLFKKHQAFQLRKYFSSGVPTKTADGDVPAEIVIGLDFGTSSLKSIVNWREMERLYAVPFTLGDGISAYILPTKVYEDSDGEFNLISGEHEYSNLKKKLMDDDIKLEYQVRAAIFIALALRKIRAYVYDKLGDALSGSSIYWRLQVGLPSPKFVDAYNERWNDTFAVAWHLSTLRVPLTRDLAKEQFSKKESIKKQWSDDLEIKLIPEISCEVFTIIDGMGRQDNGQPYVVMDVGASTVDVAAFYLTRGINRAGLTTTLLNPAVANLGTTYCHTKRVALWESEIEKHLASKPDLSVKNALEELKQVKTLHPTERLPNSYLDYFSGITLTGGKDPDDYLIGQIAAMLRLSGRMIAEESKGFTHVYAFVAGGGSLAAPYKEVVKRVKESAKNTINFPNNAISSIVEVLNQSSTGSLIDSVNFNEQEAWIRLSVAYGLAKGEFDETLVQGTTVGIFKTSNNYQDLYIPKQGLRMK